MLSFALLLDTAWSCLTLGAFGLMAGVLAHEALQVFRRRTLLRVAAPLKAQLLPSAPAPSVPAEREQIPVTLRQAQPVASH